MSLEILTFSLGPLDNNTYLLVDTATGEAVIVDPTFDSHQIAQLILERKLKLTQIWLTHAHFDHIAGAKLFSQFSEPPLPIGIHPYQREKMAVRKEHPHSRPAQSFYEVCERFRGFSLLRLLPKTGRTHQLRVHLASIGCPVLCDKQYGGRSQITLGELSGSAADGTVLLARQALHACRLKLRHPLRGHLLEFEVPLPADMQAVIAALREYRRL